jgi:hypothetical protein
VIAEVTEEQLTALLDQNPFDHTIYLALADLAEEKGQLDSAKAWRMFYLYEVKPIERTLRPRDHEFIFMFSPYLKEMTNESQKSWAVSKDGLPYTTITDIQAHMNSYEGSSTRSKSILHFHQTVCKCPHAFQKELSKVAQ